MKEICIENFAQDVAGFLNAAQTERLLVTQGGKSVALLVGVASKDQEDWNLENSPDFWRMIEDRRGRPALPLNDLKVSLLDQE